MTIFPLHVLTRTVYLGFPRRGMLFCCGMLCLKFYYAVQNASLAFKVQTKANVICLFIGSVASIYCQVL